MSTQFFASSIVIPRAGVSMPAEPVCPGDLPLVLMPVRLETRFFTLNNGSVELRVRVYPDKIHLDSHERDLTRDEQTWGQHYWEQDWRAGNDTSVRSAAWRQIADRFGAYRAAWIVRVLEPTNAAARPTSATAEGEPLAVAPVFPNVTIADTDTTWRHAPQARLLPDRWIAILHSGGQVAATVTGNPISRPLNVGPNPQAPKPVGEVEAAIKRGDRLAVDDDMMWMVDFNTAESVGMALRISVTPAQLSAGLDSLLVFGVTRSLTVAETAAQLADLLDAHHYTDGLAFMRPGTPTNNTDDRRADYNSRDPGHARSFATEIAPAPTDEVTNALRVGTALGLRFDRISPTFDHIDRGLAHDDLDMRSMNTALWPVSWGYFLSNMIGAEAGLTPALVDWARTHFLDHVRCFGPFPTLRCGSQPYGILPVTSLDLWQPGTDERVTAQDTWLRGMLLDLRERVWRPTMGSVSRIGSRNPPDPDTDLADVMRTDGVSSSYDARYVFGRHFLLNLFQRLSSSMPDSDPSQTALLQQLGIPWRPRLARLWNAGWRHDISAPLIQAGEVSPWAALEPNYIAALLNERSIQALINARPNPEATDKTTSLLHMLLRHALLRQIAGAAALLFSSDTGADLATLLRDPDLVDLVTGTAPTQHWLRQLDHPLAGSGTKIRERIETAASFTDPSLLALGEFRAGLARLKGLDSEALLLLMQGTLDLSAHRLDAWITSFATKRLAAMHVDGPAGQYIGAYGWVENLKPIPSTLIRPVTTLPAGEPGPLQALATDSGFIHAPSMSHAATAALLRNSHLGPTGVPAADGPFAIDLTSRRVREAARLLDGVRQGQPLGALLGYRLERLLHDTVIGNGVRLDRFIAKLRSLAPLVARANESNTATPVASIAANNVVDGLLLDRRWKQERSFIETELQKLTPSPAELAAVRRALDGLGESIDGLSDALTAEAAYQMARGNSSRMASTLASIAQGNAPPPELEVARTPRSGVSLTHRLLTLMSGTTSLGTPSVRSKAEPQLNAWAARLLGNASKVRCTVERLDDSGTVVETRKLQLGEVALTPLDVVYGVEAVNGTTLSEVEQQILYHLRHANATLRFQHARPTNLDNDEITLFDLLEQAREMRRLLSVARGVTPEDLNPPERIAQATIDVAELEGRVIEAEGSLLTAHDALSALVGQPATTTAESLRSALMALGAFGLVPAIPVNTAGEDSAAIAALLQQAQALLKLSRARIDQSNALRAQASASDAQARCAQLIARMRAVFGQSFVVLPRFTLDAASAAELADALSGSTEAQAGDPLAVNTWFARCSRVRDPVARLSGCLHRAEVLGTGTRLDLSVAQLPFSAGERWVALPPQPDTPLPPSKLSLVIHAVSAVTTTQVMTGLLVDEWVEVVPNTMETTALAFQFDVPDSMAPQCVLIAVPPVPGQDWTAETLRRVLMETLDLAKLRAVDTEALGAAAQHLPGLYLAFNTEDHAVSTDFKPLTV